LTHLNLSRTYFEFIAGKLPPQDAGVLAAVNKIKTPPKYLISMPGWCLSSIYTPP